MAVDSAVDLDVWFRDLQLGQGEVFAVRTVVFSDKSIYRSTAGSLTVRGSNGEAGFIDARDDFAIDGHAYAFDAAAWQDREEDPVIYEVRVRLTDDPSRDVTGPVATDRPLADDEASAWLRNPESGAARVEIGLLGVGPLHLPRLPHPDLVTTQEWLDAVEERAWGIERRKDEVQAALTSWLERSGASPGAVRSVSWATGTAIVDAAPHELARWVELAQVTSAGMVVEDDEDSNDGTAIGASVQLAQYQNAGYVGDDPSARNASGRTWLGILDSKFDIDHPAWKDCSTCTSRLLNYEVYSAAAGNFIAGTTGFSGPDGGHGTTVAGMVVADLTEGQDPLVVTSGARQDRTGVAKETYFDFVNTVGAPLSASSGLAISRGYDVVNRSASGDVGCSLNNVEHEAVDLFYLDGGFWASSTGNYNDCDQGPGCRTRNPATAAGAFAVTAQKVSGGVDLDTSRIGSGCFGGDAVGRAIVGMAAPGNHEGDTLTVWNDGYGTINNHGAATSYATPVVAGAAIDLRDLLSVTLPSFNTDAGWVHSMLGLMSDGQMGPVDGSGPKADGGDGFDPIWGAGRLRMRLLTDAGMDAPWAFHATTVWLDEGDTLTRDVHEWRGARFPLPAASERMRASAFWFEPNLPNGNGVDGVATINISSCMDLPSPAPDVCFPWDEQPQRQRFRTSNAGGIAWYHKVEGTDIPTSIRTDHLFGLPRRKVLLTWFFEDDSRDDADGPLASIQ